MNNFSIDPNDCLILKAFKESQSLRDAAQLLNCDPAGLARKARRIADDHGLLQKINNKWHVTSKGLDLVAWTESAIQSQNRFMSQKGSFRIASTMWFAEEILAPNLRPLIESLGEEASVSISFPRKNFELSLLDGSFDYVVVCHPPESPEIAHKKIAKEKWVLVAPPSWRKVRSLDELKSRPFIRHSDINLDLFIPGLNNLTESGIRINHLVGIRSAVSAGLGWSLVPQILVERQLQNGALKEVPCKLTINDRNICLWWLRSRYEARKHSATFASWLKANIN